MLQKTLINNAYTLVIASILILSGCTNSLTVSSEFPTPVLRAMPLNAGLYLSPELKQYRFKDDQEDRESWDIRLGQAQADLITTVTEEMFVRVDHLAALPNHEAPLNTDIHLIINPELKSFQYTMPRDTSVDIYEVWMKYNVQVLKTSGDTIADWIVTAYGKTPSAFLQSNEEAMNQAIIMALRDLGASYSLGFTRTPEIKQWLNQQARTILKTQAGASQPPKQEPTTPATQADSVTPVAEKTP